MIPLVCNDAYDDNSHYLKPCSINVSADIDLSKILTRPVMDFVKEMSISPKHIDQVSFDRF